MARFVLSIFFLFVFIFSPVQVFAAGSGADCDYSKEINTDFGCLPNDPIGFVQEFYGIGLSFIAALSLLALIIGGYNVMTSKGDPQKANIGKSWIFYAIGGLVLAIFGYIFIRLIIVDILKVPGFS